MQQQTTTPSIGNLPGIEPALRDRLIANLNQNLATLTDLGIAYKQAHWNVTGPDFAQLHELFDEFASQTREHIDLVAERAVTLGGIADGTVQAAAENTALAPFPRQEREELRLVEELARRVERLAGEIRDGIALSADDVATQDLYTEVIRDVEKQRWMLLAHLARHGGDGRVR